MDSKGILVIPSRVTTRSGTNTRPAGSRPSASSRKAGVRSRDSPMGRREKSDRATRELENRKIDSRPTCSRKRRNRRPRDEVTNQRMSSQDGG